MMLFLHFLMMASALLGLSSANKFSHTCKYSVHSPQAPVHEVSVICFQKPMISLILLQGPVSKLLIWVFLFLTGAKLYFFVFIFVVFFVLFLTLSAFDLWMSASFRFRSQL
jgi:hypothetical protein